MFLQLLLLHLAQGGMTQRATHAVFDLDGCAPPTPGRLPGNRALSCGPAALRLSSHSFCAGGRVPGQSRLDFALGSVLTASLSLLAPVGDR